MTSPCILLCHLIVLKVILYVSFHFTVDNSLCPCDLACCCLKAINMVCGMSMDV